MRALRRPATRAKLDWYSSRLRAMSPVEIALHVRKKWRQVLDARYEPDWAAPPLEPSGRFPTLPTAACAPALVRETLHRDAQDIRSGRWKAFGHLDVQVDDPPRWHKDYLAGIELLTTAPAFRLDHRNLPGSTDIKLIWELSRWYQLVRLAMAAYVLADDGAATCCLQWLDDWTTRNPPYRGWNWISALEAGMRLVQFTWIDALLVGFLVPTDQADPAANARRRACLSVLRDRILPPHVAFTWRHRSFGSSANNHLLGELTGLILATVRWPTMERYGAPLDELQRRWQDEVLAQFAWDGGNREQALNYQLFSWEFCWQARAALAAAGRTVAPGVDDRLRRAAQFYVTAQEPADPWDYGDSDNAFVTPFFADQTRAVQEWHDWLVAPTGSAAIDYWQGPERSRLGLDISEPRRRAAGRWERYEESGYAVWRDARWTLRWDLSPLGYLTTAAHGHLDALHLSLWLDGVAIVIDPGTGSYYADQRLRQWLASRPAHNGPAPLGAELWPRRVGPFLWSEHHRPPTSNYDGENALRAELRLPAGLVRRAIRITEDGHCCEVRDSTPTPPLEEFTVRWQFAPGAKLERIAERVLQVTRGHASAVIAVSTDWAAVYPVADRHQNSLPHEVADPMEAEFAGTTSASFRHSEWAPYLKLVARPRTTGCEFRTTFVASAYP